MSDTARELGIIGEQNSKNSRNSSYEASELIFYGPTEPLGPRPEAAERYPLEHLGPLTSVAHLIAENVQCPIGLAAQSILGAVSVSTHHIADVRNPLSGRVGPISCFFFSVALSGERKSSVDGICLEPVSDYERMRFESYQAELKNYEDEMFLYGEDRKQALKSENAQQEMKKLSSPEKPLNPMILMPEPTIEAVEKHEGSTIGIFSDEGGRLFGGHAMNADNRQKTIAGLSSLWDGKPIRRARASEEAFAKYDMRLSLHLMMQPYIAHEVLSDRLLQEQGFLARCLVTQPPSTMGTRFLAEIREPIDKHPCYVSYCDRLASLLRANNERETIDADHDAKELLRKFYNHIEERIGHDGELHQVSGFAAKSAEHALRLSALLAIYSGHSCITATYMSNGIELAQHYLDEALRLFGSPGDSERTKNARLLLKWIKKKGHHAFHAVQIYQSGPGPLQKNKEAALEAAKELVRHGYLKHEEGLIIDGSARINSWRVNGKIHEISE